MGRNYSSSYIKYPGIFLDENLNWKKHISILSSKLRRANGALAKLHHFVPTKTLTSEPEISVNQFNQQPS